MDIVVDARTLRVQVISLSGRFDAFSAPDVRQRLQSLLNEGEKYFVLNLHDLSFMDSAAMAVLVTLLKGSRSAGGGVTLVRPANENALRILMLTKFDRVFQMADTVDAAVKEVLA
ncbi:MAG: STAS domain-containing protein [Anaerolineae bacterium]